VPLGKKISGSKIGAGARASPRMQRHMHRRSPATKRRSGCGRRGRETDPAPPPASPRAHSRLARNTAKSPYIRNIFQSQSFDARAAGAPRGRGCAAVGAQSAMRAARDRGGRGRVMRKNHPAIGNRVSELRQLRAWQRVRTTPPCLARTEHRSE
jgi:hypothetical protein